jgi:flagellar motor switch protein FliN/FliY
MSNHRDRVDRLGEAIVDGLEKAVGRGCEIGLQGVWDDDEVLNRPSPLRAAVLAFNAPLGDCVVAITTMHEETIRSVLATVGLSIAGALDVHVDMAMPEVFEYETRDDAIDQLDALYNEPTLHFTTPKGDLLIVFGTGLLDAVAAIENGGSAASDAGLEAWEEDEYDLDTMFDSEQLPTAPAAQQQAAAVEPVAAAADPAVAAVGATARANQAAVHAASGAPEWESLLSGVDVDVSAELGSTKLSLGTMTSLENGAVVTLDQGIDDPVDVFVNGTRYARARLVVVGDEYGIEILEVFDEATAPSFSAAA